MTSDPGSRQAGLHRSAVSGLRGRAVRAADRIIAGLPASPAVRAGLPAAVLIAIAALPWWNGGDFNLTRYEQVLLFITVAMGANLIIGYAGELSFGYPVIVGAAAYAAGVLSVRLSWEPVLTIPAAVVAAMAVSLSLSIPGFRVKGWYLALITFFSVVILPDLVILTRGLTGGEDGLPGIKPLEFTPQLQLDSWAVFEVVLLAALLTFVCVRNLVRSAWGLTFMAMRDSPQAALAVGLNLTNVKILVAALSAVPMGVAGALMAHSAEFVSTQSFSVSFTIMVFAGVLLGGAGTLWGPVVGTLLLQIFSYYVGPFSQYNVLILGLALLIVRIVFPRGISSPVRNLVEATRSRLRVAAAAGSPEVSTPAVLARNDLQPGVVVLRASGVSRSFGGSQALREVDLELRRGRILGLVGPNGSGKTTFVNTLTGFIRPNAGRFEIDGADVTGWRPHRIARRGVARTFQIPQLVNDLSARQNVEVGALAGRRRGLLGALFRAPGFRREEARRAQEARDVCGWLELDPGVIDARVESLPLGLKRIVEVGRAVSARAHIVCLDEPAAGLNDSEMNRLGRIIRQLAESNQAVLLIEHNLPFVLDLCDDVVLLIGGSVACQWQPRSGEPMPAPLEDYLRNIPRLEGEGLQPAAGAGPG